jgi:O-antigen ligase
MLKEDSDATFLAVLAPMSLAVLWSAPGRALRVVLCLSLLASVCAVCLIVSRTAAITMVICVVGFVALMLGRRGVLLIFACAILTVLAMLSVDAAQGFQMVTKSVEDWHSGSLNGRNIPWRVGWAMFLDAPMLGHGPHTFAPLYDKYMHALGLPIPHHTHRSAHNLYVEVLAAQGLVGFASFVYLLVRGASLAWRMPRSARAGLWPVTAGALAATIGFIAAGLVELTLLRGWVVIIMLTLLGTIAHLWSCATEGRTAE